MSTQENDDTRDQKEDSANEEVNVNEDIFDADWEDISMDDDSEFDGTTSKTAWDRLLKSADRLLKGTVDVAGDVAARGKIEIEIASLRLRRNRLYAKIGELVFRLRVGEEENIPVDNPEVQKLFENVKDVLAEIARERRKLEEIKDIPRWQEGA